MKKKSYLSSILLLIAIFIVVAVISEKFFFRFDLTEGGQYSLSKATKDILNNLESPVTVTAYF
ncbi:MAG: Gldg family protein, partial [Bacteroidetes bacterium]|nr:Gldg family protein [Bacteroidota bacterium]